ncbi:MAG TPA: acyl-ACP desaturase [Gemmataceae bacterium]|jgi:acyl-[acyl-carrier-protein] desaturase|nr:acyl-ACP desaturase [Gemmataceae bacterium]
MNTPEPPDSPATRAKIYAAYRSYFDMAERKRRWNIRDDIPWDQTNTSIDAVIADVVQTFCMVELYLPDYVAKQLPPVRANRGRAWMLANWGYEESKHSMVLEDWLVRSGHRTEKQMAEITDSVLANEWEVHYGTPRAAVIYTTFQELATQLHYRNLRRVAGGRDPALDKVLELVSTDEAAHAHFFRTLVQIYLEDDREATLVAFRHVMATFHMPASGMLADGRRRAEAVRSLGIFDERVFHGEVYTPLMRKLGLTRADLKPKKVFAMNGASVREHVA